MNIPLHIYVLGLPLLYKPLNLINIYVNTIIVPITPIITPILIIYLP